MELDHIEPRAEGGRDNIENAIPVCFECHAEIHSYNDQHPRGRKFRPEELRAHKESWLNICDNHPEALIAAPRDVDVGPLQALLDELDFNSVVASMTTTEQLGCLFLDEQFKRATQAGAISVLENGLKDAILRAYAAMGRANQAIHAVFIHPRNSNPWAGATHEATDALNASRGQIATARAQLLLFLTSEG